MKADDSGGGKKESSAPVLPSEDAPRFVVFPNFLDDWGLGGGGTGGTPNTIGTDQAKLSTFLSLAGLRPQYFFSLLINFLHII